MSQHYSFQFPLPNGLHARPASHFAGRARAFASSITLRNERSDAIADVKSVLSMVAADVRHGDACAVTFAGVDEQVARDAFVKFIEATLPTVDEPLPQPQPVQQGAALDIPRSLSSAGLGAHVRGVSVSRGVAIGKVLRVRGATLPATIESPSIESPEAERAKFVDAHRSVLSQMNDRPAARGETADVLDAHRALVNDPELHAAIGRGIDVEKLNAAQAVLAAGHQFVASLERSASAYLRERVLDLQDVILQLLAALGQAGGQGERVTLTSPSICVADYLTPGQLLSMDPTLLKGVVLGHGGTTSHTVILARARGIPMLVDLGETLSLIPDGADVVVDAQLGLVAPLVGGMRRYYELEARRLDAMRRRDADSLKLPARPIGGDVLDVGANISSADEVADTRAAGADGIGLFRTEMLFLGRAQSPSEEEQFEIYKKALTDAGGAAVIIRTFDIGGDKPALYLKLRREANPFLGNRGVRLYATQPAMIRDQLRALLRAAKFGQLKILVPMVASVEEVRAMRGLLERTRDALAAEGVVDGQVPPLGVMIEVPSAALIVPQLAREVDFFSIGSNDLTQYLVAADRDNPDVAGLYTALHPALWKMIAGVAADARTAGRWVGLCGELAENDDALPLLVGAGLDEISTSATRIAEIKRRVRSLDRAACAALLDAVKSAATGADVTTLLNDFRASAAKVSMLEEGLIDLRSDARSKEEALKELADRLWLFDRATDARAIEHALWAREESYSTGFGYGCAVPHCKSSAVIASSIAVSKLAAPVMWNADGTNPVDLIIMLVLREQDHGKEHLRVLAQLSRMLMRDEFRDAVRQSDDAGSLLMFLNTSLNLSVPR